MVKCEAKNCINCTDGRCKLDSINLTSETEGFWCEQHEVKTNIILDGFAENWISYKGGYALLVTRLNMGYDFSQYYKLTKEENDKLSYPVIYDNTLWCGTKAEHRYWSIDETGAIKYNPKDKELNKATCDYLRKNNNNFGILTSIQRKMIMEGINI